LLKKKVHSPKVQRSNAIMQGNERTETTEEECEKLLKKKHAKMKAVEVKGNECQGTHKRDCERIELELSNRYKYARTVGYRSMGMGNKG